MDERQEIVELEKALRTSLQHRSAPDGFTVRVKQRVAERSLRQKKRLLPVSAGTGTRRAAAWWTAVAATLALSAGADRLHLRHQQQQVAQQQVDYAMQMTTHALDEVEMGVNRSPAGRFAQLLNETQR